MRRKFSLKKDTLENVILLSQYIRFMQTRTKMYETIGMYSACNIGLNNHKERKEKYSNWEKSTKMTDIETDRKELYPRVEPRWKRPRKELRRLVSDAFFSEASATASFQHLSSLVLFLSSRKLYTVLT